MINEYPNQMDKEYVKTGRFNDNDRAIIMGITGGDPYTKLIADMYLFLTNKYNPEKVEPTELKPREKEHY